MTARGLTTSLVPCGGRSFQIDFDFVAHRLLIAMSDGATEAFGLRPKRWRVSQRADGPAAGARYRGTHLDDAVEIADPCHLSEDRVHTSYDPERVNGSGRFWCRWIGVHQFRAGFIGKVSPVHFFWGSFDLAVTRFSGGARRSERARTPSPAKLIRTR